MFTNQKVLGIFLVVFLIAAAVYFTYSKFTQEVSTPSASPSPSPANLSFLFDQPTPTPAVQQKTQPTTQTNKQVQPTPQPTPSELPLAKNKRLSQFPGILRSDILQNKKAVIQTAKGIIQLQIYPEASMAASNFMILAANGFYDGLTFHRVEDWVVQGGDPNGDGKGGPGYQFPDELVTRAYTKGIVAIANAGPNTNGSQFFILKKDYPLQSAYTIFAGVISGMDIVEKITPGDVMQKVVIQNLQ